MLRTALLIYLLFVVSLSHGQSSGERAQELMDAGQLDEAMDAVILDLEKDPNDEYLLYLKGSIFFKKGNYEDAAITYSRATRVAKQNENKDLEFVGKIYLGYGKSYYLLHQFQRSIRIYKEGLEFFEGNITSEIPSNLNYNLTSSFARLGKYDSAMLYLEKVYRYDLEHGDSSAIASDLNSLGFMYGQTNNFEKALDYYHQSLDYRRASDKGAIAMAYSNIGVANTKLKKYKEAKNYLDKSFEGYREIGDSTKMYSQLVNMSSLFQERKNYNEALINLLTADKFFSNQKGNWAKIRTKLQLAQLYLTIKNYSKALRQTEIIITYCQEDKLLEEMVNAYDLQVKILDAMNRPTAAYSALKKKVSLADSLQKEKQIRELSELELKFVTRQKEKEIDILQLSNQIKEQELARKKRDNLFLIIGILLLTLFALIVVLLQRQKHKLQNDLYSKEIDELRLQIGTLLGEEVVTSEFTAEEINDNLKEPLSEREFEILQAISSNQTNKEIADSLFISINTVKFHLKKVYEKLGVANRKEAIHFLIKSSGEK